MRAVSIIMICLFAAGFISADAPAYSLRSGDILEISVYDEPDLKTVTRVSYNGEISFPLINAIKVTGLSTEDLERRIQEELKKGDYLRNPQVTVYVKEYSTLKIYVYGSVNRPGAYEFQQETPSILKAIAMAGGVTEKALETEIRIIRKGADRKYKTFTVNMRDLILGERGIFDVPLDNGDIISVPEAPPIYVFGEVSKEGIVNYEKDMRILQAVTMAGGFTEKVNRKKIMVLRLNSETHELEMFNVNFEMIIQKADRSSNIEVQPYDIIIAPESWL